MSKPYFSILIPVFNQVGKMDECIKSIKDQTFTDYEVIFVDDGSTDDSLSMLQGFAAEDDRYRVVSHGENKSLLCARYTGMREAQGERIVFLDSDDYLSPDTLETLHDELMKNPVDVLRMGLIAEPYGVEIVAPEVDDALGAFFDAKFPPQITTNCISSRIAKKAVEEIDPPYCNSGEDTFMVGTLYAYADSHKMLQKSMYHYVTEGGMSRGTESMSLEKLARIKGSLDNCSEGLIPFIEKNAPEYVEKCKAACRTMYKYEICHFILNAKDERQAVEFLERFDEEWLSEAFEYGCTEVLTEFFKRRLIPDYEPDIYKFNVF